VYVPTEVHRRCLGKEMSECTAQEFVRRRKFHSEDLNTLKVYTAKYITAMTMSKEGNISTNYNLETP